MKKYKAILYGINTRYYYYWADIEIDRKTVIVIDNDGDNYKSKRSAKRAAERVAKKLNIELTWTK